MPDREDFNGKLFAATCKHMPNGEVRYRTEPKLGQSSDSVVSKWTVTARDNSEPEWQGAHFHLGYTEYYQVMTGYIGYVSQDKSGAKRGFVHSRDGGLLIVKRKEIHNIILSPNTLVFTWQEKTANLRRNPAAGNRDWWPADPDFPTRMKSEMDTVRFKLQFMKK